MRSFVSDFCVKLVGCLWVTVGQLVGFPQNSPCPQYSSTMSIFCTQFSNTLYLLFSSTKFNKSNLLLSRFYPLSTVPITTTTTFNY